jgi:thiol-disulfide isomerase/thioredoxin
MRKILFLLFIVGIVTACNNQPKENQGFTVKGELYDAIDGEVFLLLRDPATWKTDTITTALVTDGKFSLSGTMENPAICYLRFVVDVKYKDPEGEEQVTKIASTDAVVLSNTDMIYETWVRDFSTRKLWGSPMHTKIYELVKFDMDMNTGYRNFLAVSGYIKIKYFEKAPADVIAQLTEERKIIYSEYIKLAQKAITPLLAPESEYTNLEKGLLIEAYGIHDKEGESLAAVIVEEMVADMGEENYHVTYLNALIERAKIKNKVAVNADFVEIETEYSNGEAVKLSSLIGEGKYVLVDFWASWCAPCRSEFPFLRKDYEKYHSKGFEIFAVSIDKDMDAWKSMLETENFPWINTINQGEGDADAQKAYSVAAIPANFLIGPKGKIIDKNLRGEYLEEKLKEILGGE